MTDQSKDLYKHVILEYNKNPLNFAKRTDAHYVIEAYNPVCGDQYKLYFDLKDGKVEKFTFHGYGCAISKASTSILSKLIEGKTLPEIEIVQESLKKVLAGSADTNTTYEELLAFEPVKDHPGRLQCVTLSWESLQAALSKL